MSNFHEYLSPICIVYIDVFIYAYFVLFYRYSNNLQDDRQSSHGHYEENLKTVMFFHPHLTHPKWDHANVNGTHHPDRRFSRMSVHPLLTTIPRDAFGPRLSTVVDEAMASKSPGQEDDRDSLLKCSELEYASGGLLSFNAEENTTSAPHRVSYFHNNFLNWFKFIIFIIF